MSSSSSSPAAAAAAAAALDWSVRGRLVEVSPVSASECFLLVPLVAVELDDAPSSSSESTIMTSSSSAGAERWWTTVFTDEREAGTNLIPNTNPQNKQLIEI